MLIEAEVKEGKKGATIEVKDQIITVVTNAQKVKETHLHRVMCVEDAATHPTCHKSAA